MRRVSSVTLRIFAQNNTSIKHKVTIKKPLFIFPTKKRSIKTNKKHYQEVIR
ncbi:hypothetical protein C942_00596 [Photobacterium marinum]|uniref:Uncharacterized protein n=1 Tax=Photobacterium marinum TaxID=1056511 RepID=L8JAS7_9GAMM|nr:hypothetical protein C942_00596 [Photobacterium marinum]